MKYLTVAQVAERFSVSADTVRRWIRNKTLQAINISPGRRPSYRIAEEAVEEMYWMPAAPVEPVEFEFIKSKMR